VSLPLCLQRRLRNPHSMVEESESMSMDAHEQRDVAALLSFKSCITSDPSGKLSNWTAHNSHNICSSWYGIRCRPHTNRVVPIDLHAHWESSPTGRPTTPTISAPHVMAFAAGHTQTESSQLTFMHISIYMGYS